MQMTKLVLFDIEKANLLNSYFVSMGGGDHGQSPNSSRPIVNKIDSSIANVTFTEANIYKIMKK